MRLVDRVLAVDAHDIEAVSAISGREPCFAAGTGPYPEVLVLEALVQAAAVLWLASTAAPAHSGRVLAAVRGARFGATAGPGDVLRHHAHLLSATAGRAVLSGRTTLAADGRSIVEVREVVLVRPK